MDDLIKARLTTKGAGGDGVTGKRKRTNDGIVPKFNGRVGLNATLGQVYEEIPAKKIPKFLLLLKR